ncbi:ABC transporter ATP-binding protein [Sporosarcina sp. HYO08]|uniref:ABC transporter ATP-binding protein n=1 Tax=Sporosarcina sp. HYO08 TaxID=1759557 RepID=UPI000792FD07|nr:ABC transporter ATP-binding protein [Sporosarcina sp. HYO08]KXH87012.1 ABC transporter [Sporosarcina sp. HYO08]
MSYLSIKNLTKTYGGNDVLRDVSFELEKGMFLSLLGPSGCGKTTILRIIAGLVKADEGVVSINNTVIDHLPPNKRDMGIVFQSYALFPHMTVEQNIAYGLEQRKMSKSHIQNAVKEAIHMVQLEGFEHRTPKQLSGGQQQRVALARAMIIQPKLLLLDESLSALDKKLRMEMQVELRQIQKKSGITTVFVTHDQDEAMTMSDQIALMSKGKIEQIDTPKNIYNKPVNQFVANFLGKSNTFTGQVVEKRVDQYLLKMNNGAILQLPSTQLMEVGKSYTLIIRPEKIHMFPMREENSLQGIVKFCTYTGSFSEYLVDVAGQEFTVQQQNRSNEKSYSIGEEVWIRWDAIDTLAINQ